MVVVGGVGVGGWGGGVWFFGVGGVLFLWLCGWVGVGFGVVGCCVFVLGCRGLWLVFCVWGVCFVIVGGGGFGCCVLWLCVVVFVMYWIVLGVFGCLFWMCDIWGFLFCLYVVGLCLGGVVWGLVVCVGVGFEWLFFCWFVGWGLFVWGLWLLCIVRLGGGVMWVGWGYLLCGLVGCVFRCGGFLWW
uniref:Uncharacterized protein n=1 Tax=Knipowitschia caucasica TaxID=637954 RepID=A0AAV2L1L4_KNICA